jgi:hypothetical protein
MIPSRWLRRAAALVALLGFALLARLPIASAGDGDEPPAPTGGEKPPGEGGEAPAAGMGEEEGEGDDLDDTEGGLSQESVDKAISKGVAWLKAKQGPDGSWGVIDGGEKYDPKAQGDVYKHPAGPTALALLTLLKCKVPVDDASVKKGFKFLRDNHRLPGGSYEASAMLLAVTATADPFKKVKASTAAGERVKLTGEYRKWAQDLKDLLLKKREALGWRYNHGGGTPEGGNQDLSSTMFACIALFAADRCGIKTDSKVWNDMITYAMQQQEEDGPEVERAVAQDKSRSPDAPKKPGDAEKERYGKPPEEKPVKDKSRGFAYIKGHSDPDEGQATGGMTACGLATILFSRHILFNRNDKLWASRDQKAVQQSIYDGLAWLDANWSPSQNPKKQRKNVYHVYYQYCVERAMDLIGAARLGKHFWYMEMGQQLLSRQKPQGFWHTNSTLRPEETLDTCFALLFLKRATKGGIPFPSLTESSDSGPAIDNRGKTADEGGE